jgi:hypothetical protein
MGEDYVCGGSENRKRSNSRTEDCNTSSGSDSSDPPFEPDSKRRKFCQSVYGSCNRATDRTRHTPAAGLERTVGPDGLGYESQPEGHDVEHVSCDERQAGTGHASAECVSHEGSRDSGENVLETGKESEEVSTASQAGALCTPKDSGTDTASSEAASVLPDGRNDQQLSERTTCPICFEEFMTQDVGTTDTCNHSYCLSCLQEWTKHANTCPVDRKTFNFIDVRHHLKGEIISRIAVEKPAPQSEDEDGILQSVTYCEVCDECDRQDSMLVCGFCEAAYHTECLDAPLQAVPLGQWICPLCFWFISVLRTEDDHGSDSDEESTNWDNCTVS